MPEPDLLRLHRDYRDKVIEYWFHITGGRSRITTNVGPRITQEFPHFADGVWQGQSTTSDLVLVNVDTSVIHPAVYFYSPAGDLIAPESVVDLRGDVEATVDGGVTTAIEPSGEWTLSTRGRNELVTGSVRVISDGPLGGILRFNDATAGVAGVGAGQPVNDAIFPARRQAGGINTGAAIRNLGEHAITVRCQLLQEGNVRMETQRSRWRSTDRRPGSSTSCLRTPTRPTSWARCAAGRPLGRCSPVWPWRWISKTVSSPPCRSCPCLPCGPRRTHSCTSPTSPTGPPSLLTWCW